MPRSSTPTTTVSKPTASRIVRRTTSAPKALRVIEGGKTESNATGAALAVRSGVKPQHADFATACLPHQAELYGVAMRICRNPDNAKDLVQETLLRAMVAWASFEPGSNLRAWLFRILTNSFINSYRKRSRHQKFAS